MHTDVSAAATSAVVKLNDRMAPTAQNDVSSDWRLWCRLCAKDDPQGNISVFFKDEQQSGGSRETAVCALGSSADLSLASAIGKYFWVEIKRDEQMPKMLCTECFSLVTSLVNFSERVAKVQQMFCVLHNTARPEDLHGMRLKYGLLDEEREHVLMQHQLPEVHYFESKPKINELEERIFGNETLMTTTINPLEQQPRIKIKIKKEDILDEPEDDDPDDEDEDYDGCNLVNEEYEDDENDNVNKNAKVEEDEDEEDTKPLKLRARTVQRLMKPEDREESLLEPVKKRRRRRCRRKRSSRDDEEDFDEENENDDTEALALSDNGGASSYPCSDCPRKFKRSQPMRQHMKRAHAKEMMPPALPCTQCSKVFTTPRQLETHLKVHLPPELRKVVPCPYCDKKFSSHTLMQTHIKYIHMNERPFICEECGIAVRTNAALKTHMLTHTDYAPFECEVCKKGFKNQIRLKNHMETHDPNKHVCAKCGLQLNSRATLNRHLLVHSDEIPHKCDYCGRAFKRAKALKNHLILHTGLKPYSCDFCDRTFANGSNCRSHKKKSHPEELAALEAAGGGKAYTRNIPKLEALKAVTKAADNLAPVVSKQSGRFAFGKKPKLPPLEPSPERQTKTEMLAIETKQMLSPPTNSCELLLNHNATSTQSSMLVSALSSPNAHVAPATNAIPNINNIYSHIMKQATLAAHNAANEAELALHKKRPASQASSCMTIDNDGVTVEMSSMQQPTAMPPHLYTQIIKQNMSQQEQQQQLLQHQHHHQPHQHHHLASHHTQMHVADDVVSSIRSPDSQTSSHMADDHTSVAASAHFYSHIRQNLQEPYI